MMADPISERCQALSSGSPGRGVLIQADQPQAGMLFQQQGAVAAAAKGGVDQQPLSTGQLAACVHHRLRQHRHMAEQRHRPAARTT